MPRALITGILGQDGAHLAELLLGKGYEVHGLVRRSSSVNTWRVKPIKNRLQLHEGDLLDQVSLHRILVDVQPDEVYSLAAMSHVGASFGQPLFTCDVTGLGVVRLLEAVRQTGSKARVYQASSSELFGSAPPPQNELTPFKPRSPYGYAKLLAHWATINAREAYGMHASCGILFNHEGPLRGETFVTRKITKAVARIKHGLQDSLTLGNLDAKRDWGHARDYVEAMWLMLQQDSPDDYVVATGEMHSVGEFVEAAFTHAGLDWRKYVRIDPKFTRPADVPALCGDASKARARLHWRPRTTFSELVRTMVDADLATASNEARGKLQVTT